MFRWNNCFLLLVMMGFGSTSQDSLMLLPTIEPAPTTTTVSTILPSIDDIFKDGKQHHCYRACDGQNKTCYYHFKVEWYQSMSKACFDCPFNSTDCDRKDCVVADGFSRPITVVNRKMPGPSIEVCQHDRIVVDVQNDLLAAGTTIHWHGMHQKASPYMDGTPYVTQCPIQTGTTFRYEFMAEQSGTYFWHSHIGLQRGDGVTGALDIRKPKDQDAHGDLYDYDLSEHKLLITDWSDHPAIGLFTKHYHAGGGARPAGLLINGRGRFSVKDGNRTAVTKPTVFNVTKGYRYRFRLINAEFLTCPVQLSVDGHNISVIASDGSDLVPVTASSLVSYSGERFDFIISANNSIGNYFIRVRGLLGCAAGKNPVRQIGVLHYDGAECFDNTEPIWNETSTDGLKINNVNEAEEQLVSKPVSKLKSLLPTDDSLKEVPDYKFYIAYDMYRKNSVFNKYPYYGYDQVPAGLTPALPQLNHISMKLPTSPFLVSRPSAYYFCNETNVRKSCDEEFCQCPHVLSVKLNSTVEIILIDEGETFDTNHPFHLHGYSFRVVGQRRLYSRTTVEKVKSFEKAGLMERNLVDPPLKDTVTIPDGGYTIIRFHADNPGYWLFHCHIEFHAEVGMSLVFKVGENEQMLPVPEDFPTCGDFTNGGFTSEPAVVMDGN